MAMGKVKRIINQLNWFDYTLLVVSLTIIIVMFIIFPRSYWSLASAIMAVTSVLFVSKGMPLGQILSILYCFSYFMA